MRLERAVKVTRSSPQKRPVIKPATTSIARGSLLTRAKKEPPMAKNSLAETSVPKTYSDVLKAAACREAKGMK